MKTTENQDRYDVLIVNIQTREVDTVAGCNMRLNDGFHHAEKRMETVSPRLNDHYFCGIYSAGKFKKGDVIPENEETF